MSATSRRACRALSDRLVELLPPEARELVGGTHTRRFADNLLPGLSQSQIAALHEQLSLGSGGELKATATGRRPGHAPYSSAALAANAFGRWLGSEPELRVAGLGGFTEPLRVEGKLKIAHGGGTANLGCLLTAGDTLVGVESKLTETLTEHKPVHWRDPYRKHDMRTLLDAGWDAVLAASLEGSWQPRHVGLEQLVKHALALASRSARERHLIYVYWEPVNGGDHAEVLKHREEVAELVERVGEAQPRLHVRTYAELLDEWAGLRAPDWLPQHVAELRQRYELSVPTG